MHSLARELFPFPRSLTGDGVRQTLRVLERELPGLIIHEVPSGTAAFDWVVPDEWNARAARITGPDGKVVVDFNDSNLHLVGYSEPIDGVMSLATLDEHLHSDPELPDSIPYVTAYYHRTWGFCLSDAQRRTLVDGDYHVDIDSRFDQGSLTYGELVIPGTSSAEVLLSTYICHPSLANNELSGPVVLTAVAKWLHEQDRRFTYRLVFIPESIGALLYSSMNLRELQKHVVAGINLTCIGDDGDYSFLASREGKLTDRSNRHKGGSGHATTSGVFLPRPWKRRKNIRRTRDRPALDLSDANKVRKVPRVPQFAGRPESGHTEWIAGWARPRPRHTHAT